MVYASGQPVIVINILGEIDFFIRKRIHRIIGENNNL